MSSDIKNLIGAQNRIMNGLVTISVLDKMSKGLDNLLDNITREKEHKEK